ncbi:hypothetical protein [Bacillus benzoevorans]|uniref:Membrane-spanning protein n=1 Tax=Bacillus benzoevorans TaxID=1456 RepID=A0A7X0LWT9_9BACI|nr:hypothetical protein [Bacillus benzoevorans]MBB6446920.1 hypothetical protein [Bacillus benzoevorans]
MGTIQENTRKWKNITRLLLLVTLLLSILFIIIRIAQAPTKPPDTGQFIKVKSDYVLTLLQCCLGIVVMRIPAFIERKKAIDIPDMMEIIYFLFLFCAIYLGEVHNFYYLVPYWDNILHAFSGAMLGAMGIISVTLLNDEKHLNVKLSPFFIVFFGFCFALTAGTIWEIYEFLADGILSLNMQKFILANGSILVGREALSDTMMDLIVDALSALLVSVIGYFNLKKQKRHEFQDKKRIIRV